MNETNLRKRSERFLKAKGVFFFHPHGGGAQLAGASDHLCCYLGRFLALEYKMPGKEKNLTKLQANFLRKVRDAGGVGEMVTSVEQVRVILREMEQGIR